MPLIHVGGGSYSGGSVIPGPTPDPGDGTVPTVIKLFKEIDGKLYWRAQQVDLRAGEQVRQTYRVDFSELTEKKIVIATPIDKTRPTVLTLIGVGGGSFPQVEGVDYIVSATANEIVWDGYGMDGLVAEGDDMVIVFYERLV